MSIKIVDNINFVCPPLFNIYRLNCCRLLLSTFFFQLALGHFGRHPVAPRRCCCCCCCLWFVCCLLKKLLQNLLNNFAWQTWESQSEAQAAKRTAALRLPCPNGNLDKDVGGNTGPKIVVPNKKCQSMRWSRKMLPEIYVCLQSMCWCVCEYVCVYVCVCQRVMCNVGL